MGRIDNKVAIITGAGSGMGEATALLFAKEGASVICIDVRNAENTAKHIIDAGGKAVGVTCDVSKLEDWANVLKITLDNYKHVDILCNVAGIAHSGTVVDVTEQDFKRVIDVNLLGVFLGMKTVIPEFIKNGAGKIVNVSSLSAHCGLPGLLAYTASKGGVCALTRQAAVEYAKNNIQINAVSPGMVATGMKPVNIEGEMPAELDFGAAIPLGRQAKPEEIANVLLFLSSDDSTYLIGQDLLVDGGWSAQ